MFIRIAGVSAVLAGLFVVAFEVPSAQSRTPVKVYMDRAPTEAPASPVRYASTEPTIPATTDAPRVTPAASAGQDCRRQAWPYVDPSCGSAERKPVRTITIERREAPNSSTLVRVPIHPTN